MRKLREKNYKNNFGLTGKIVKIVAKKLNLFLRFSRKSKLFRSENSISFVFKVRKVAHIWRDQRPIVIWARKSQKNPIYNGQINRRKHHFS
jgi:hypothetical protein